MAEWLTRPKGVHIGEVINQPVKAVLPKPVVPQPQKDQKIQGKRQRAILNALLKLDASVPKAKIVEAAPEFADLTPGQVGNVSNVLRTLEKRGMVIIKDDGQAYNYQITPLGKKLITK